MNREDRDRFESLQSEVRRLLGEARELDGEILTAMTEADAAVKPLGDRRQELLNELEALDAMRTRTARLRNLRAVRGAPTVEQWQHIAGEPLVAPVPPARPPAPAIETLVTLEALEAVAVSLRASLAERRRFLEAERTRRSAVAAEHLRLEREMQLAKQRRPGVIQDLEHAESEHARRERERAEQAPD